MNKFVTLVVGILVVALLFLAQFSRLSDQHAQISQTNSVLATVTDSIHHYRDKLGRVVAEKQAIEAQMQTLDKAYRILSVNQKALVQDIKKLPAGERKKLVMATSVEQTIAIVDHVNIKPDSAHVWRLRSDTLNYTIRTLGDSLHIDSLLVPNRLVITQHREAKGVIRVTARNTNPMVSTQDVDSIIIPAKKPSKLLAVLSFLGGIFLGGAASR